MDGLSKALAGIPPQNVITRTERPSGNQPHKEPMQIRIEDIEGGIQVKQFKFAVGSTFRVRELDGTVNIKADLMEEAYKVLKDAGYADSEMIFDIGKQPKEYRNNNNLPDVEFKFDSAENLLNSIFDSFYRNIDYPENNYTKIIVTLNPPNYKPPIETPPAPPAIDEGRMKVGDILYPGKKNYGPVEEPAYDVTLSSRAGVPDVEWSMEGVEVELKTDEFRFDENFEVIKTNDIFAEIEAREEKFRKSKVIFELACSYNGNAFQKWIRDFKLATKYAATDRAKFQELADAAQKEYDEAMKPFYELNRKYAEDGDYEAYINSSLFDPYRKNVLGDEAEAKDEIQAK